MFLNIKKFNKEINRLQNLPEEQVLPPLIKERIKLDVLRAVATDVRDTKRFVLPARRSWFLRFSFATLGALSLCAGTAFASTSTKPGDVLYPIKKVTEQVQLGLATSEQAKVKLQTKFAEKRLEEFEILHAEVEAENKEEAEPTQARHGSKVKAEVKAQAEVKNALDTLTKVQTRLQTESKTVKEEQVNESLNVTITKLQTSLEVNTRSERKRNRNSKVEGTRDHRGEDIKDNQDEEEHPGVKTDGDEDNNDEVQKDSTDESDETGKDLESKNQRIKLQLNQRLQNIFNRN